MLATGGICARMNLMPVPKKGTLWRQLHLFHIICLLSCTRCPPTHLKFKSSQTNFDMQHSYIQ